MKIVKIIRIRSDIIEPIIFNRNKEQKKEHRTSILTLNLKGLLFLILKLACFYVKNLSNNF